MMYLEIDREVGDRLGDGDFAGLRCGHRVICKCPKPILNTKYWKKIFIRSSPCEGGGGGDGVKVQHGVGGPCTRGRRSHNHLSHNIPSLGSSCILTLPLVHYSTESLDLNFFGKYDIHHCCSKPLSLTTLVQEDRKIP